MSRSREPPRGEALAGLSAGGRSHLPGSPAGRAGAPPPGGSSRAAGRSSSARWRARPAPGPGRSLDPLEARLLAGAPAGPSSALSNELKIVRTNEKEQLQGLNDRFVSYIETVRQLEQHNRLLEAEAAALRQRQGEPSRLRQLYERELRELRELRARAEALRREGDRAALESQQLDRALQPLRDRAAREAQRREEAERTLRQARQEADRAALARLALEKKAEALLDELAFLRRLHEQEVAELQAELRQARQVSVEIDTSKPDLTAALKEIRTQYEVLSARNQQSAEEWYKSKFANFTEEAARSSDSIRQAKEEISEYRRQLQAQNIEIESLRSASESLERQLQEAEERSGQEIGQLRETVDQLETALRTTKGEMARHLQEYQDLLNVKMALDIEIAAYRKLLEGEETRLSTGSSTSMFSLGCPFSSSPLLAFRGFSTGTAAVRKGQSGSCQDPEDSRELKATSEGDSEDEGSALAQA